MAELERPGTTPSPDFTTGRLRTRRLPSERVLVGAGVAASLGGLTLVLAIMFAVSDFAAWSWVAVAVVWPLGALASLAARRPGVAGPMAMIAAGLLASLLFAWEYGMAFGVPLQVAGLALVWRRA